ncbi:altered inheritance of mitochondria protein 9, mitochondrial [Podospora fimiseda]|uniref:Altered inheritance of mitochondria protein 9, mitochondrial n=1 Tax=Podospora fimiseda TaxID=252190 RepID=A0AAN7BYT7_9PEZI|nr:altered inheritance of mitochondria protein 9, mitochondrial [Podospora fimiseda]
MPTEKQLPLLPRDGLTWDDFNPWVGLTPQWTREPSLPAIESIARRALGNPSFCKAKFFSSGAFNKLYLITTPYSTPSYLLCVSLPVDPLHKVQGEDNEIGFEWILMELMEGRSIYYLWRKFTFEQKVGVVERVAEFLGEAFGQTFKRIGTLSLSGGGGGGDEKDIIAKPGKNYEFEEVERGPYRDKIDRNEKEKEVKEEEEEEEELKDDIEEAEEKLEVFNKLEKLLPKVFSQLEEEEEAERTVIWHDDLSLMNILVDEEGKVTGIVDWECVSTMPLWAVYYEMPQFLRGRDREEEENELDNEGKTGLYSKHLMEFEQTELRKVYEKKMSEVWAGWGEEVKGNIMLKKDFYEGLRRVAEGWWVGAVGKWVDVVEKWMEEREPEGCGMEGAPRLEGFLRS